MSSLHLTRTRVGPIGTIAFKNKSIPQFTLQSVQMIIYIIVWAQAAW